MKPDERDTRNTRYMVACDRCKRIMAVSKKLIMLFAIMAIVLGCSTVGNKPEGSGSIRHLLPFHSDYSIAERFLSPDWAREKPCKQKILVPSFHLC